VLVDVNQITRMRSASSGSASSDVLVGNVTLVAVVASVADVSTIFRIFIQGMTAVIAVNAEPRVLTFGPI
jgi:hypothetical protein